MFKIIKDGAQIGMTEAPNYIKKAMNGCYNLCPEPEAQGIVFSGIVYQLLGRETMEDDLDTISLEETDAGREITKAAETNGIMFVTLTESGSIDDVTAAEHADLFTPWLVTGAGAEAAAAAFFFVDADNSSDHVRSPYNLFVENLRELYEKMSLQIFAASFGSEMIIREKKDL